MVKQDAVLDGFRARLVEAQQKQADLLAELEESRLEAEARHSLLEMAIRAQQTAIRGLQEGLDDLFRGEAPIDSPASWDLPAVPASCVRPVSSTSSQIEAAPPGGRNADAGGSAAGAMLLTRTADATEDLEAPRADSRRRGANRQTAGSRSDQRVNRPIPRSSLTTA